MLRSFDRSAVRIALAVAGLCGVATAMAAAPPTSISAETPQEAANKKVVLAWSQLLFSGHAKEAFEKYVSKDFIEHSHLVTGHTKDGHAGYQEALDFLSHDASAGGQPAAAKPAAPAAAPPAAQSSVLVADDDHVTMYSGIGADTFRVKDGKITDHWDASPSSPVNLKGEGGPPSK